MAGIEYTIDSEDDTKSGDITELDSIDAEKDLLKEDVNLLMSEVMDIDDKKEPVPTEENEEPKGLMTRRTV